MSTSELDNRNIALSMRKSVENLVISSQDAIGQSISQALTFSGVISQQANQMLQETKNMSRSPSPSLRGGDLISDNFDTDKLNEMAIHVPSHPAGDTLSVSSADVFMASSSPLKPDLAKLAQGSRLRDSTRTKKKSWYNSLYPTYKSKSDDFKRLFKDLPDDERLIVDYSCALQKDILLQGRLYASQNYLCFYANIFGWETSMSLKWKEVTAITKEKTALVIPNAILVCTDGDKNFLTSFSGRDKAYLMLFRIWQNALMDQPMSSHEIWQWVHTCYGEELGFNSDDEEYPRDLTTDTPAADSLPEDAVDSSSMEASGGAGEREHRPARTPSRGRESSPPLIRNGDSGRDAADTLPTDMSDTSDSEPDKPNNDGTIEKCSSEHSGKLILRQQFPFNIDLLFTMIFTNSKFNLELLAARGTSDYVQEPWQPQGGHKCRQVSYTLSLSSNPVGPKEVHVTETQLMNKCSKPGQMYSIDATSENAGIPYADYFTVEAHYCLQRVADNSTDFSLYGYVKYKKSMWPMIKSFLEKSTISAMEEYARLLAARVSAEAGAPPPKARRLRRPNAAPGALPPPRAAAAPPRAAAPPPQPLLLLLLALLAINGLLYYKLYYTHQHYTFDLNDLQNKLSGMGAPGDSQSEWWKLVQAAASRQRGELRAWRHALARTGDQLRETEKALRQLLETIKPTLDSETDSDEASETSEGDWPPTETTLADESPPQPVEQPVEQRVEL